MPEHVPLTDADCFLRAFDGEVRRYAGASHVSQLVLRLGPGFDVEGFRKLLAELVPANPILRAPIGRPYGVGAPVYRTGRAPRRLLPPVRVHEAALPEGTSPDALASGDVALPERFFGVMNERFSPRRGELLRFDVVRYAGGAQGCDLAMSWLHMLFDGSGSEGFVAWLDACFRGVESTGHRLVDPATARGDGPAERRSAAPRESFKERGARARAWQKHVQGQAVLPVRSLAGPLRRQQQALRYHVLTLDREQTERVTVRAKEQAGFLTPMLFYLAASVRAHHAVFRARGQDPGSYVVPLPVNLRPKGSEGAIFRTHVSLLWFQVRSELVDDFAALVDALKEQRRHSIRDGIVEGGVAAMEFARYAPGPLYAHMARRHLGGELCSFFFAFTGNFLPGMESFLGAPIRNGFHAAPVPPSPGSCAAMSLREGRLNVTHVFQQGLLSDAEHRIFRDQLLGDLLGEG